MIIGLTQIVSTNYREHLKLLIHHDYGIAMDERRNQGITRLIDNIQFNVSITIYYIQRGYHSSSNAVDQRDQLIGN